MPRLVRKEPTLSLYEISADFPGGGTEREVACCFDPRIVLIRLRDEFGRLLESDGEDVSWRDYEHFEARVTLEGETAGLAGCLRIAANDARRRGPNYRFCIHWEGVRFHGNAERYVVRLSSEGLPIPEELRRRFQRFLESLPLVPFEVRAVKIDDDGTTELD